MSWSAQVGVKSLGEFAGLPKMPYFPLFFIVPAQKKAVFSAPHM